MPPPAVLWDESAAFDQLKALIVAACPEVPRGDIYRARPGASPGKYGSTSIQMSPLTAAPEYGSPFGGESDSAQQQRWKIAVTTAAAGAWAVTVLGQAAPYVASGGDSAADIVTGLRTAVDLLGAPVTTQALAAPPAAFGILGDTAGQSLGVAVTAPAGGAYALTVVDDNIRRAVYNWGTWRVRLIFRSTPATSAKAATPGVYDAAVFCERVRLWLQASSIPVTNGLACPYYRDNLAAAPGRLSWLSTGEPFVFDEVENQTWTRVASIDVAFQTPVALTHDVPSLDAIGLASAVAIDWT